LCRIVDIVQTESVRVPVGPLEIVANFVNPRRVMSLKVCLRKLSKVNRMCDSEYNLASYRDPRSIKVFGRGGMAVGHRSGGLTHRGSYRTE
jgi:hypothetical protein